MILNSTEDLCSDFEDDFMSVGLAELLIGEQNYLISHYPFGSSFRLIMHNVFFCWIHMLGGYDFPYTLLP